jgi:hypothetical protein
MKYQKPEAEVKDFKALEANATMLPNEYNQDNIKTISAFGVTEGFGFRDKDFK